MTEQVLTRAGGRVEVVALLSQDRTAAAQCGLFTQNQSRSYLNHLVVPLDEKQYLFTAGLP